MLVSERLADRLEVVPGIQAFRDRADRLAERLAVAQVSRAGEHLDLGTGVVDVILARDVEPGGHEEICQHVADHGAAAMADMHRTGRIGRHVFDVDALARAHGGAAETATGFEQPLQCLVPVARRYPQVDETGPRDLGGIDIRIVRHDRGDPRCQIARLQAHRFGQNHRRVAGQIAMGRIARRFDDDPREIDILQYRLIGNPFDGSLKSFGKVVENIHDTANSRD